ncbi:MAG: hypothetical protein J5I47_13335, partial [Vicingus serpentipes]|nr:hypothetical protein [Vicingus serpentipes]
MNNKWVFDIETFINTFSLVAKNVDTGQIVKYLIHEDDTLNQAEDLYLWLYEKPLLIGYNNLGFDGQVIEKIWLEEMFDPREIYDFATDVIESKEAIYKPWHLSFKHLDLQAMSNYTIYGKPTSLKWLEFTTRRQTIRDMPHHHSTELDERHFDDLLRYNLDDVLMTEHFYNLCKKGIEMRNVLVEKYRDEMIHNQPNSSIGEKIVLYSYADTVGLSPYKIKSIKPVERKRIKVKDIILPYLNFEEPIFKEVKEDFKQLVLIANKDGVISLKKVYEKEIEFQKMKVKYGLGGIHGCVDPGIYQSTDTHVIKTYDVTSMYPNIAISNRFFPEHLGDVFCDVYGNILIERRQYPKGTELNLAYKEAANSVYGKSNSKNGSYLKDPRYTLQTTINGQLALSLLGERLAKIGEFLIWNTDGSEIIIPREKEEEYNKICEEWCKLTGIELEHDEYDTLWIRDVNTYIGKFVNGKVKRKGFFCIYDDYIGAWDKNPSGLIIPEAINKYFLEGIDPHETITNWNNIHDFLFGLKGGSTFEYWTVDIRENAIHKLERYDARAIRYYMSTEGKSILKNWLPS